MPNTMMHGIIPIGGHRGLIRGAHRHGLRGSREGRDPLLNVLQQKAPLLGLKEVLCGAVRGQEAPGTHPSDGRANSGRNRQEGEGTGGAPWAGLGVNSADKRLADCSRDSSWSCLAPRGSREGEHHTFVCHRKAVSQTMLTRIASK
jgi:hypothetical protein